MTLFQLLDMIVDAAHKRSFYGCITAQMEDYWRINDLIVWVERPVVLTGVGMRVDTWYMLSGQ